MKISPTQFIRKTVVRLNDIHKKYPGLVEAVGNAQGRAGLTAIASSYPVPFSQVIRVESLLWQIQDLLGRSKAATAEFVRGRRE